MSSLKNHFDIEDEKKSTVTKDFMIKVTDVEILALILKMNLAQKLPLSTPIVSPARFYFVISPTSISTHKNKKLLLENLGCWFEYTYSFLEKFNPQIELYYSYCREEANIVLNLIKNELEHFGNIHNFVFSNKFNFCMYIEKNGKPTHLFKQKDIYNVMYNADDRHNNTLVVNENGCVEIIQDDIWYANTFPVRLSPWTTPGYVGKYANLNEEYINKNYRLLLVGWLKYLRTGQTLKSNYDDEPDKTNEDLIEEIRQYY
jgi:hypothetical protein